MINVINTKLIQQLDKLGRNIKNNEGTDNKVSDDCKTSGNYDEEIITINNGGSLKVKQVTIDKVNNNVNEVFMHDTVNSRNNESRKLFGVSNRVAFSVDELEKEWRDHLNVEWGTEVKFFP